MRNEPEPGGDSGALAVLRATAGAQDTKAAGTLNKATLCAQYTEEQ